MTTIVEEPAQTFCECGKPLKIYRVPLGNTALPIKWIKKGCDGCKRKAKVKETSWVDSKFGKPCETCGKRHDLFATPGQNLPKPSIGECSEQ